MWNISFGESYPWLDGNAISCVPDTKFAVVTRGGEQMQAKRAPRTDKLYELLSGNSGGGIKSGISLGPGMTLTGTQNTAILKEALGEGFYNIYSIHEDGDPRIELDLKGYGKILDIKSRGENSK